MSDIIKDSSRIREVLLKRWEELEMTKAAVVKDANERGMKIPYDCFNRWSNNAEEGGKLTSEEIAWLCFRYFVPISLNIGVATPPTKYVIPPYNETKALKLLAELKFKSRGDKKPTKKKKK